MIEPLRAALVGYGQSGRSIHARLIDAVAGIEVAAVVAHSDAAAMRASANHPDASVVRDLDELEHLDQRPDLVVIATPDDSHDDLAARSLSAGFTTLVDKPMSWSSRSARHLVDLGATHGMHALPFLNRRWDGDFLTVRRLIDAGTLGDVVTFETSIERWIPVLGHDWRGHPYRGGLDGALGGFGTHLVDQAIALFGPVAAVSAEVDTVRPGSAVNDRVLLSLDHQSGVRTRVRASLISPNPTPRFSVSGIDGGYQKFGMDGQQPALVAGGNPADPTWGTEAPEKWGTLTLRGETMPVSTERGRWTEFYRQLVDFLRDRAPAPVSADEAIHGLRVLEAALESHSTGSRVRL